MFFSRIRPEAGTVAAVNVTKGTTGQSGDVLVTLA